MFCNENGFEHNFSAPRNVQQNSMVEREYSILQEMVRTMLNENDLLKYFWTEVVNTSCHVLNRVLITPTLNNTPYELWKVESPTLDILRFFDANVLF